MEMAGKQFFPFMETVVQPCLTACTTASYGLWKWLASSSSRLWKRLCNYVLQLVQLRLTTCVTASYGLWKWLASSSSRLWKRLYNHVLQLVQLCLTACTTASYDLCNCVLQFMEMAGKQFSPFMETVL